MARVALSVVLCLTVASSVLSVAEGKCSQFGHSCFGAHGKRGGEQYGSLDPADLYPPSNQLAEVDEARYALEEAPVTNPRNMVKVRDLMDLLSHLLRQRPAPLQQQQQRSPLPPIPAQLGPNDAYLH
ncbi:uncharacterized protein LOC123502140 [Portunus trituberculatus]|uniref:uncharacterized protein LOC123502140 n=1 Tax=Portunus trituberculatus TaxID=210409 RepID=UPI001E1CEF2D|nr:uncharacterized protein LOC123502140 [Portunus trituberculatus]